MYIVFENEDKTIGIIVPSNEYSQNLEALAMKDVPEGLSYKIVERLPDNGAFRNSWKIHENEIVFNLNKAREIKRNMIRKERIPIFQELDLQVNREIPKAILSGNNKIIEELEKKKQSLRDAPANLKIENAKTIEELMIITIKDLI